MANATIRVTGLRELDRAFRKMDAEIAKDLRDELKKAGEPVARSAASKLSRYQGASLSTIKPIAMARGAFVRQTARKVTGRRGDFGALQMRVGLIPALNENQDEVIHAVEGMIDRLAENNGF